VGAGCYENLAAAAAMSRAGALFRPDAQAGAIHAERHALFSRYYSHLRGWQRRFRDS
jgi:hypothetical protein